MSVTVQRSTEITQLHVGVDKKGPTSMPGGWTQRNPDDPEIIAIGEWAVNEYDKQTGAHLKFLSVVGAATQVVAGINYHLILVAQDGDVPRNYDAYVWDKPWEKFRQLTSFVPLSKK